MGGNIGGAIPSRCLARIELSYCGEVPERSNGAVSKTVVPLTGDRGFESLPLRQRVLRVELPKVQACARGIVMDNPRDTSLGVTDERPTAIVGFDETFLALFARWPIEATTTRATI